jgi:Leucine-rich repeat (LRR) protein
MAVSQSHLTDSIPFFLINDDTIMYSNFKEIISEGDVREISISNYSLRHSFDSIFQLSELRSLSFFNCDFDSVPEEIKKLKKLERLNFAYTKITALPEEITRLKKLKSLSISKTDCGNIYPCEFTVPEWIYKLPNLTELCIYDCAIERLPPRFHKSNIRTLIIHGGNFSSFPHELNHMSSLDYLVFSDSGVHCPIELRQKLKSCLCDE